jgi:Transglycosylase SLT domain
MSWMKERKPAFAWLRDTIDFFGVIFFELADLVAEKGVKRVPYGKIVLGGLGLTAALMLLSLGIVSREYYGKITVDHELDRQKTLFEKQLNHQQRKIQDLQQRVEARESLESEMLAMMDRYDSPLEAAEREKYVKFTVEEARRLDLDPTLVFSLIAVESGFNPRAVSHVGATGMAQLRPYVAKAFAEEAGVIWRGNATLNDPMENTRIGLYYLTTLLNKFGDLKLALEAYNHGPTGLERKIASGSTPTKYSGKILSLSSAFNV